MCVIPRVLRNVHHSLTPNRIFKSRGGQPNIPNQHEPKTSPQNRQKDRSHSSTSSKNTTWSPPSLPPPPSPPHAQLGIRTSSACSHGRRTCVCLETKSVCMVSSPRCPPWSGVITKSIYWYLASKVFYGHTKVVQGANGSERGEGGGSGAGGTS